MRILNTLRLLVSSTPPSTGVAEGALFYNSADDEAQVYDGSGWSSLVPLGVQNPVTAMRIQDQHEVLYFDGLTDDGVITILGDGVLIGVPPISQGDTGPQGPTGPTGPQGPSGLAPATFLTGSPTVTASTADNTGMSFTISGNTLTTDNMFEFRMGGFVTNTVNTTILNAWVMVNGTKQGIGSYTLNPVSASRIWEYDGQLRFTASGVSGGYVLITRLDAGDPTIDAASMANQVGGRVPATIDTTATITIDIGVSVTSATGTATYVSTGRVIKYFS